jgi:hypothetical protein
MLMFYLFDIMVVLVYTNVLLAYQNILYLEMEIVQFNIIL